MALEGLEKFTLAKGPLDRALVLEPSNAAIKNDYDRVCFKEGKKKPERKRLVIEEVGDAALFNRHAKGYVVKDDGKGLKVQSVKEVVAVEGESNEKAAVEVKTASGSSLSSNSTTTSMQVPAVPNSFFEFEAAWRTLKGVKPVALSHDLLYQYLKQCLPDRLSTVLSNHLPVDLLATILTLVESHFLRLDSMDEIIALFEAIGRLKRIDMVLLLLTRIDKDRLKRIFKTLEEADASMLPKLHPIKAKFCQI